MTWARILLQMLIQCFSLNLALGVFNLLPFPPLDGSKILAFFLRGKARDFIWSLERYSTIILLILFVTELPSMLIAPVINGLAELMISIAKQIWILFL